MGKPKNHGGIDPRKIDELSGPIKGLVTNMISADEQNWPHSGPHGMDRLPLLETLKRISDGGVKRRWGYKKVPPPPSRGDDQIPVDEPNSYYTFFFEDRSDMMIFDTWWLKPGA